MKWFLFILLFLCAFGAFIWFSVGKEKVTQLNEGRNLLRYKTTQRVIDANANGQIDAFEISKAKERLLLYDKNKNGILSMKELGGSKADIEKLRQFAIFRAIDTDGNGTYSKKELAEASEKIKNLDRNNDGIIEASESNGF